MALETARQPDIAVTQDIPRFAAAMAGIVMGVFLLYGVAFAGAGAVHDAAHDTRHAFTMPCH